MPKALAQNSMYRYFGVSMLDIATVDKIRVIRELTQERNSGLALDIGIGTGYTTYALLGDTPTVCLDIHEPNLRYFRDMLVLMGNVNHHSCIVADATALPFKPNTFRFILCSEVLEHVEDDQSAVNELARVLGDNGKGVITAPNTCMRFTGFLELLGIPTVHDFPGPERHVRHGYDYGSLTELLRISGLDIERFAYYLRFFTKLMVDIVSLAHLLYQRSFLGRHAWTWFDVTSIQQTRSFRIYSLLFPVLESFSGLDRKIRGMSGFGLIAIVRKTQICEERSLA